MLKEFADLLNLCETEPDRALEFLEKGVLENPEMESTPMFKFAKAIAYGSKGLFQMSRRKPELDLYIAEAPELRRDLKLSDEHLGYLEMALIEIREMEEICPRHLETMCALGDEAFVLKADVIAVVLEKFRPGRVQQILGKTKLLYFGHKRIMRLPEETVMENRVEDLPLEKRVFFMKTFFSFRHIVRSALPTQYGVDARGRTYVHCMLFERTPDDPLPGDIIAEAFQLVGSIYLFDDGSFSERLEKT